MLNSSKITKEIFSLNHHSQAITDTFTLSQLNNLLTHQVEKIKRSMVEYESRRRKYVAYYQSKKDIQMDNMLELQNIPLPDNIPLPKELPPKLNSDDNHESVISLVSLPSNVAPPPPPSGTLHHTETLMNLHS